jgi:hypothetical protein
VNSITFLPAEHRLYSANYDAEHSKSENSVLYPGSRQMHNRNVFDQAAGRVPMTPLHLERHTLLREWEIGDFGTGTFPAEVLARGTR